MSIIITSWELAQKAMAESFASMRRVSIEDVRSGPIRTDPKNQWLGDIFPNIIFEHRFCWCEVEYTRTDLAEGVYLVVGYSHVIACWRIEG